MLRSMIYFLVIALGLMFSVPSFLMAASSRSYTASYLSQAPDVDGQIKNDPAWSEVSATKDFTKLAYEAPPAKYATKYRVGVYKSRIYFAFACQQSGAKHLKPVITSTNKLHGGVDIYGDDSIEIFISATNNSRYFHFLINNAGAQSNEIRSGEGRNIKTNTLPQVDVAVQKHDDRWTLEVAIPLRLFLPDVPTDIQVWTMNVARNVYSPTEKHSTWTPMAKSFQQPNRFGDLHFLGIPSERIRTTIKKANRKSQPSKKEVRKKIINNIKHNLHETESYARQIAKNQNLTMSYSLKLNRYREINKQISGNENLSQSRLRHLVEDTEMLHEKLGARATQNKASLLLDELIAK